MQGIYAIRNTVDEKRYVGSAVDILRRWARHRKDLRKGRHHAIKLQRAWDKHGESAFAFEVLVMVDDVTELLGAEQRLIDEASEYNSHAIAGSPRGFKHTPEAIEKIRVAMQRLRGPATAVQRARWSEVRKGRKLTDEARANMSKAQSNRPPDSFATREAKKQGALRRYALKRPGV